MKAKVEAGGRRMTIIMMNIRVTPSGEQHHQIKEMEEEKGGGRPAER